MLMRIYVVGIIWASLGTVTSSFSAELHCRIDFFFYSVDCTKNCVSQYNLIIFLFLFGFGYLMVT